MDTVEKRLAVIKGAVALSDDPALLECARIKVRMLAEQIGGYTSAIAKFDAAGIARRAALSWFVTAFQRSLGWKRHCCVDGRAWDKFNS